MKSSFKKGLLLLFLTCWCCCIGYGKPGQPREAGAGEQVSWSAGRFSAMRLKPAGTAKAARANTPEEAAGIMAPAATATTWDGSASTDWSDPENWSDGLPSATTDALVPAGPSNMPVIATAAAAATRDLTISTGASLTLAANADLSVYGTFVRNDSDKNGSYQHTDGRITFAGTGDGQSIPALIYQDLRTAGGAKVLAGNITVNGVLTIAGSTLSMADNVFIDLKGSLAAEDMANYVNGRIRKTISISGIGSHTFGNIGLTFNNTGEGDWGNVSVTRVTGQAVSNPVDASQKSISRQWQITPEITANTEVTLTLAWLDADNNGQDFSPGKAQVWRKPEDGSGWIKAGQIVDITKSGNVNTVTVQTTAFSTWTITKESTVLPVTWLSFAGTYKPEGVQLHWRTAMEKNNQGFRVERSLDGKVFKEIGQVAGVGNSNAVSRYAYVDVEGAALAAQTIYYRLTQVDTDKTRSYSHIIAVTRQAKAVTAVYPNPFAEALTVHLAATAGRGHLTLSTLDGRVVYTKAIDKKPDTSIMLDDLPDIIPGVYLLKIMVNNQLSVHKLVRN